MLFSFLSIPFITIILSLYSIQFCVFTIRFSHKFIMCTSFNNLSMLKQYDFIAKRVEDNLCLPAVSVPSFRSGYGSYAQCLRWSVHPIAPAEAPWPSPPRRGSSAASNRRFSPISLAERRIPCSLTRFPGPLG